MGFGLAEGSGQPRSNACGILRLNGFMVRALSKQVKRKRFLCDIKLHYLFWLQDIDRKIGFALKDLSRGVIPDCRTSPPCPGL